MPALQSPWFASHVVVYMILMSSFWVLPRWCRSIYYSWKNYPISNECSITDNLAYVSLAFLTFKTLTGAFWIKETWGHYWSWAPRRLEKPSPGLPIWSISTTDKRTHWLRSALWILITVFALLQMCWKDINYLSSAQDTSIHTYNLQWQKKKEIRKRDLRTLALRKRKQPHLIFVKYLTITNCDWDFC